jgi:PAS domain S-box-containing protein
LDCKASKQEALLVLDSEILGRHLHQVLPKQVAGLIWHHVELALETNEIQILEYQLRLNGKFSDFEARLVKSGLDEVVVIVQDITERVQARVALQQVNDALEMRVEERTAALSEVNHILRAEIIERKKAEQQLRNSEERFRQAVVNAPFPIMIHAEDGEVIQINQVWTDLTGYTHPEIPTIADWAEKAYGERQEIVRSLSDKLYDLNDQGDQGELAVATKEGATRIWHFRSAPSGRLSDGRHLTISMATDITERKQAEKEVRFLHSVAQAIFESQDFHAALNVALQKVCEATGWDFGEAWVPRADGSFLDASSAWYTKSEGLDRFRSASTTLTFAPGMGLPGRVWLSKQPEWRRDVSGESNEVYLRSQLAKEVGLKAGLGIPILTTDGVLAVLVFYMFESQDQDERLIELISASTELGLMIQRKQAEGEIRKALEKEKELTELKSRFISMTSHEFRTPLTTIQSSAELLERYSQKWTPERKLTHLHRIQTSVKHMTKLLNDVLIIGKAEAGKLKLTPAPLELEKFCGDLVEELQLNDTNQHAIAFTCGWQLETGDLGQPGQGGIGNAPLSSQFPIPCMDEKLLRQILENLLSNAIKYSPTGSTVDFTLSCFSDRAIFQIRDRGIGIPAEDQQRLFETFHRAANVGTIAGTGLGLAIVKKCVDIHQGQVVVESEIGVGTTFTVTLPILGMENLGLEVR